MTHCEGAAVLCFTSFRVIRNPERGRKSFFLFGLDRAGDVQHAGAKEVATPIFECLGVITESALYGDYGPDTVGY